MAAQGNERNLLCLFKSLKAIVGNGEQSQSVPKEGLPRVGPGHGDLDKSRVLRDDRMLSKAEFTYTDKL